MRKKVKGYHELVLSEKEVGRLKAGRPVFKQRKKVMHRIVMEGSNRKTLSKIFHLKMRIKELRGRLKGKGNAKKIIKR